MKRLAIFQSGLKIGGIERSLLTLLSFLADKPVQIDLFLFSQADSAILSALPGNVRVHVLERLPLAVRYWPFDLLLPHFGKKTGKQAEALAANNSPDARPQPYDLAIDYNSYWNECALGALSIAAKRRVCWIHNDLQKRIELSAKYRLMWWTSRQKFARFDDFAAVSSGAGQAFAAVSGIASERIRIIPNLIDEQRIHDGSRMQVDFQVDPAVYNLASMGRLVEAKGFEPLLDLFADVIRQREDLHLYLIGDGPLRAKLEQKIEQNKMSRFVTLLGQQANPFPYLRQMDGFVLNSQYEGQGIVLLEAKALGLDVLIPKRLEAYISDIEGSDDLGLAILDVRKRTDRQPYSLADYNRNCQEQIRQLLDLPEQGTPS